MGGGITGAFTAFLLAREGVRTTLVERSAIGAHASGNNPGGLNPLHGAGIPGPMQEAALAAMRLHLESWEEMRELSGIDFRGRLEPRLQLACDEDDLGGLSLTRELYDAADGFSARSLDAADARACEPRLGDVAAGLWTEGNARVDAPAYVRAVAQAAEAHGAELIRGEVRRIETRAARVEHVFVDQARIACEGVVVATGAWCTGPEAWLGIRLPVEPLKGELVLTEPAGGPPAVDLLWRDAALYREGGLTLAGGSEERTGFDAAPTERARERIVERAARVLPAMREAPIRGHLAALRPVTPDGMPIVGRADGFDNVVLALGSGRKGMLLSSVIARAATDLSTTGTPSAVLAACAPDRFAAAPS